MKLLKLSSESHKKLIELLRKLYPDTSLKRIELKIAPSGITSVFFSKVGKNNIQNWIGSQFVNSEIPLLELFLAEIPELLSVFRVGNKTFAPLYLLQFSFLSLSTGDNLVKFLEELMEGIQQPKSKNDYKQLKKKLDKLGGDVSEEERAMYLIQMSNNLFGNNKNDTIKNILDIFMLRKEGEESNC